MIHRYALRNRPPGYGAVPPGRIPDSERPHPKFLHGTIDYEFELTAEEIYRYELVLVEEQP